MSPLFRKLGMFREDLTGKKYNKLTAVSYAGSGKWTCLCDCGNTAVVETDNLKKRYKSCGCMKGASPYLDRALAAKRFFYRNYKKSAEARGHSFSISFDELINLSQQNCYYCGEKPSQLVICKSSRFICNGIDRVNNSEGYEIANLKTCCKKCNRAKWKRSHDDFILWVKKCYNHLIENNINE
jgi:hypothetical protein